MGHRIEGEREGGGVQREEKVGKGGGRLERGEERGWNVGKGRMEKRKKGKR